MAEIQGVILFCDDVRDEKSGKTTIVGIYGPDIRFPDDSSGVVPLVGCFNARVRGAKSVHLRVTVEVQNHSVQVPPYVIEQDFEDKAGLPYDEWTLRINSQIQVPFERGAILKMSVEGEGFKADASLVFEVESNSNSAPDVETKA